MAPVVAATGVACEDVAHVLAGIGDGSAKPSPPQRAHIEACLHCQAELVHYRRLLRVLRSMWSDVAEPSPGTLAAVLAHVEAAGDARALRSLLSGRRAAYLGGVVVATAASAAGVLVWATRRRLELAS
jgi:hypothetical protein